MQKYIACISLVFISQVINSADLVISDFCELVHFRTYYIHRLEQSIALLKNKDKKNKIEWRINKQPFKEKHILNAIDGINAKNTLQPFFNLWDLILSLKYLDDKNLLKEFAILLYILHNNLRIKQPEIKNLVESDLQLSLAGTNFTEAITIRIYYAHRLQIPIQRLKSIKCNKDTFFEHIENGCDCTFISNYDFQHPAILSCIKKIDVQSSLSPVLDLWLEFSNFKQIQDELFLKEFLLLVFTTYRNLLINNAFIHQTPIKKATLEIISQIYEHLESIPLEQILEAIDVLTEELPEIMQEYEINSDMAWKKWLKKYWWVGPVVGTALVIRIYMILKPQPHPIP